ncbi:hypothetical protein C0991_001413 [Blastosporella zonata]|nr:hypothetical protein C0991_001413 [Blastosporella zonata]
MLLLHQTRADSMGDAWVNKVAEVTNSVWRTTPYSNIAHIDALLKSSTVAQHPALLMNKLSKADFEKIWEASTKIDYIGYMCEGFAVRVADGVGVAYPAGKPLFQHTGDGKNRLGHGFVAMAKPSAAAGDPYQLVDSSISVSMSQPVATYIWQDGSQPFTPHPSPPTDNPHKDSAVVYRSTGTTPADIYYWDKNMPLKVNDPARITAKLDRAGIITRTRRQARGSKGLGPSATILLLHDKATGPNVLSIWAISYPSTAQLTLKTYAHGVVTSDKTFKLAGNSAEIAAYIDQVAKSMKVTNEEKGMMHIVLDNLVTSQK